jgi:Uma2 family endonuclease
LIYTPNNPTASAYIPNAIASNAIATNHNAIAVAYILNATSYTPNGVNYISNAIVPTGNEAPHILEKPPMVQTPSKSIILEEFLKLPETKPASEYIDGRIIQKPMPQGEHSVIQGEFVTVVNAIIKPQKIARAFPELRCTFAGQAIVPDVSVFVWNRIPRKENGEVANVFSLAPDWVIEILSPDQSQTKVTKKILHCLENGTQMGWLIDPDERTVFVYLPKQQTQVFDEPEQLLPVQTFTTELQLTVRGLFVCLLE